MYVDDEALLESYGPRSSRLREQEEEKKLKWGTKKSDFYSGVDTMKDSKKSKTRKERDAEIAEQREGFDLCTLFLFLYLYFCLFVSLFASSSSSSSFPSFDYFPFLPPFFRRSTHLSLIVAFL